MKVFLVNAGLVSFIGQCNSDIVPEDASVKLQKAIHINEALIPGAKRPSRIQVLSNVSTFDDSVVSDVTVRNVIYTAPISEGSELHQLYTELVKQIETNATGLITSAGSDEVAKLTTK